MTKWCWYYRSRKVNWKNYIVQAKHPTFSKSLVSLASCLLLLEFPHACLFSTLASTTFCYMVTVTSVPSLKRKTSCFSLLRCPLDTVIFSVVPRNIRSSKAVRKSFSLSSFILPLHPSARWFSPGAPQSAPAPFHTSHGR